MTKCTICEIEYDSKGLINPCPNGHTIFMQVCYLESKEVSHER